MPPEERPIPRFVAEAAQEGLPYGRWAEALGERFLVACREVESDEDLGEPAEVVWFPDRTFAGRTYVPASATTSTGYELLGYVSYTREHDGAEARNFEAFADYTDETAEANPDWELDLSDRELASFNGGDNRRGEMTLVWGVALVDNVALGNYTGDFLEVKVWGQGGGELATESLYEDD